jgi:hypothetical protein
MSEQQPFGPPPSRPTPAPAPTPVIAHHLVTDQRPVNGAVVAIAWVVTVLTVGYMLPWAIAATRGTSNQAAVGLVNLLLGWTFVGWVVALVMACRAHRVVVFPGAMVVAQQVPGAVTAGSAPAGWYPAPGASGQRYWDGAAWTGHHAP